MADVHVCTLELVNRKGLHARAAAKFVKTCEEFRAEISVAKGEHEVCGLSIMGLMMLAAQFGSSIEVRARGDQALAALEALTDLVRRKFDEEG